MQYAKKRIANENKLNIVEVSRELHFATIGSNILYKFKVSNLIIDRKLES